MLPFHIDEANARAEVDKWINGRWFAPSEFKKYNDTGSFSSIYVAYFTYDANAVTDYNGERGSDYTVEVGDGDDRHEFDVGFFGQTRRAPDDRCLTQEKW